MPANKTQLRRLGAGLCACCGERPPEGSVWSCAACKSKALTRRLKAIAKWKSEGRCANCGGEPVPGLVSCGKCRDKQKSFYRQRKSQGACVRCKAPSPDKTLCSICRAALERERQSRLAKGLCSQAGCGAAPRPGHKRCDGCRAKYNPKLRERDQRIRRQVLDHYGNACACCGEATPEFLQVDHVNNDGAAHRRELSKSGRHGGAVIYRWLIKNAFPPGFQLLCSNCNCAKGFYGICPHERARREGAPQCGAPAIA